MKLDVVSLDLDGTLIHPAIFNAVADGLGFGEPLARSYAMYLAGTMSLEDAFHHDYTHLKGRAVADMWRVLERTDAWTPGIREAVAALRAAGMRVILTTDQPRFLSQYTARFGIEEHVCSEAEVVDGVVTGRVEPRFEKWPNLEAWLRRNRVDPARVAHVGNGSNDIPVFARVGYGLAVNAEKEAVVRAARASIPKVEDLQEVARHLLHLP